MASTSFDNTIPAPVLSQGGASRRLHPWALARLNGLLSEDLRRGSPSELVRYQVLAGSNCLLLLLALLGVVAFPSLTLRLVVGALFLSYGSALVMLRRAKSHMLPAIVLCMTSIVGGGTLLFILRDSAPYFGTHAGLMLQPALAVYLLGARRGLFVALAWACVALIFPVYYTQLGAGSRSLPDELLLPLYVCASFSFVISWGLGSLHSSALTEAQCTLDQTMKELRDSEGQLLSVFESTDDLVFAVDTRGGLITANAAAKHAYFVRYGQLPMLGQPYFPESEPGLRETWTPRLARALAGERQRYEEEYELDGARLTFDISVNPVRGTEGRITGVTVFARNITARKQAELRLGEVYRTLVDVSRQAGMAEIATGVLHNVGNTLNSVNVSTTLVIDRLRQSRIAGLAKISSMLRGRSTDLSAFLTQDPQGKLLPEYISTLAEHLHHERDVLLKEMKSLSDSVDHIKSIVSMQQKHARIAGALEEVSVPQLIDEALRLHAVSFERLGIRIERDYATLPPLLVDRHRLLQILVNLLSNARDALISSEAKDKSLRISVRRAPEGNALLLQVADNGIGIAPENVKHMFTQGFTTKKKGHGFGLHTSSLAALEMRGRLSCHSPGPGQGATFTLELPPVGVKAAVQAMES
ncbi:ATP-binding protein [Hyalangium rubrum]|uniref:histidine kinase n=1 Tax=Hyalangium rubrum TaxID=3103134 RepID=A0ABU5H351_9BACT|nr:ATP-binding protein [Hyalangium sp. s54d21]MDY7227324.1 ATP-binding protein [Hyalangium sp. s54d21]